MIEQRREASGRRLALLRGGRRAVVRLGGRTHPHRGFQRRLSGRRDAPLVETVGALPGLRALLALMVIVSVALMLIGPQLVERIAELVGLDDLFVSLWGWLRFPVALLLLAVVLSVVYRFGPNVEQRFRSVVVGAALAVVLWAISSVGFSFYLANFADYGVTYGSLGAAVGLLFYSTSVLRWCCWVPSSTPLYSTAPAQDPRTPRGRKTLQ